VVLRKEDNMSIIKVHLTIAMKWWVSPLLHVGVAIAWRSGSSRFAGWMADTLPHFIALHGARFYADGKRI
jgi:hypothetical protein